MAITYYRNGIVLSECVIISFQDGGGIVKKLDEDHPSLSDGGGIAMLENARMVHFSPEELKAHPKARFYRHIYRKLRAAISDIFFKFYVRHGQN